MPETVSHRTSPPLFSRNFVKLLIAQASFGYAFSSFFMLPKYLVTELGAGPLEIGWVAMAYGLAVIAFIPTMGVLVDRHGRRRFMIAGALLMAIASLAFVLVSQLGALVFGLRALQGVAFAMVFVGGATIAVDEAPPERIGQAIAVFGLTMVSMNGVAAASVERIAAAAGWSWAFGAAAAAACVCAGFARGLHDGSAAARIEPSESLWRVATRPRLVFLFGVIACVGAAMSSMLTFHQPFAIELGIARVSGFFVAYALATAVVRVGLGHFIDRLGRRRVSIASLVLYSAVVTAMAKLAGPTSLVVLGAGLGVAHGFCFPALNSLAISGARSVERGKVMALFQGSFHVGFAAAALGFGWLAENAGYPAVFVGGGVCAVLALALLVLAPAQASSELGDGVLPIKSLPRDVAAPGNS